MKNQFTEIVFGLNIKGNEWILIFSFCSISKQPGVLVRLPV